MNSNVQRIFIPGDKWIYFKLYMGYKTADIILTKTLPIIISQLNTKNILAKWFFIRYADPHSHLRLRFYVNDTQSISYVLTVVNQAMKPYVSKDLIWKIQVDTYQRELERYGINTIEHAENLFHFDSDAIINILSIIENSGAEEHRWLIALKMLDVLLGDFEFDIDQKIGLLTKLSEDYRKEFGFTIKEYKFQLDKKFRANRKQIEEIMNTPEKTSWAIPLLEVIKKKSQKTKQIAKILLQMESKKKMEVRLNDLLTSHAHMMINRLFRTRQRMYEMVFYDTLERYYSSIRAKMKYDLTDQKPVKT